MTQSLGQYMMVTMIKKGCLMVKGISIVIQASFVKMFNTQYS